MLALAADGTTTATVVDECIDCLLEHTLFVAHDDVGSVELHQALETVVAVNDAAIEVVQVRRRKATAVELDHRAQVGWDDRQDSHDHPLGLVAALAERLDDAQALRQLLALGAVVRRVDVVLEDFGEFVEVDRARNEIANGACAHLGLEDTGCGLFQVAIVGLAEDALRLDRIDQVDFLLHFFEQAIDGAVFLLADAVLLLTGNLFALFA